MANHIAAIHVLKSKLALTTPMRSARPCMWSRTRWRSLSFMSLVLALCVRPVIKTR